MLDGTVAEIVLSNPPLNLFDAAMLADLEAALDQVTDWVAQGRCRALLMRAEGRAFCAGVDVNTFLGHDAASGTSHIARHLTVIHRLESLTVPTLAVVHDLCLTIGFEASLGCDLIWAAQGVEFGLVEAKVGMTPGAGGTQRLVARAGYGRAAELVYSGSLYTAEQLLTWGVVNRVLPAQQLLPHAREFAHRLASGPPRAHAVAKQILLTAESAGVLAADRMTAGAVGSLLATNDLINGVRSLLEQGPGRAQFDGS